MRGIHGVRTTFLRDVFVPFGDSLAVFWVVFVRFTVFLIVSVPLGGFRVVLIRLCFGVVHFVPIPVGVRSGPLTIVRSRLGRIEYWSSHCTRKRRLLQQGQPKTPQQPQSSCSISIGLQIKAQENPPPPLPPLILRDMVQNDVTCHEYVQAKMLHENIAIQYFTPDRYDATQTISRNIKRGGFLLGFYL